MSDCSLIASPPREVRLRTCNGGVYTEYRFDPQSGGWVFAEAWTAVWSAWDRVKAGAVVVGGILLPAVVTATAPFIAHEEWGWNKVAVGLPLLCLCVWAALRAVEWLPDPEIKYLTPEVELSDPLIEAFAELDREVAVRDA
jgi:hypothetical protein